MPKFGLNRIFLIGAMFMLSMGLSAQKQVNSSNVSAIGCPFYIPNAFTPNGDNINERFVVAEGENCQVVKFHITIFDRWGRLVFESTSPAPEDAWDGTYDGERLAKGVYIYNVTATLESANFTSQAEEISRQGTVVLIR